MTRNSKGETVPQCEATYETDGHHVHCTLERGHAGQHSDARGGWEESGE